MKQIFIIALAVISITAFAQQDPPPRVSISLPNGRAADIPPGPYTDSWESIRNNYEIPQWFVDGKFGIFMLML